jgi:serine O-acetyltransferase
MIFTKPFVMDIRNKDRDKPSCLRVVKRLFLNPGYRAVVYYRIASEFKKIRFFKFITALILMRLSRVPGVEIGAAASIEEGFKLPHPHDIVIGYAAQIGKNVTIYNGVTLGAITLREFDTIQDKSLRYPTIEAGSVIFSGAKILGPVTIGENSIVGANSVVTKSFPKGSIIIGVPARAVSGLEQDASMTQSTDVSPYTRQ